jgi:hemerythrin-like domain-containing protein
MLTSLKTEATPVSDQEDAIALLLGCHDRIRHFTEVADRLNRNQQSPPAERQETARAVLQYYEIALPLHEADENESVYPRLRKALPPGELAAANQTMIDQHTEIDDLIAQLLPLWRAIGGDPVQQESLSVELTERVQRLKQLWCSHLSLEEEMVIPAMRRFLSQQDLGAIAAEMRSRRQPR